MTQNPNSIESDRPISPISPNSQAVAEQLPVFGGVDTHLDFHVAAVVNAVGALLAVARFPTNPAGYRDLLAWLEGFGPVMVVGVEGTGSYGAALARHLHAHDIKVLEVNRPDRAERRRRGKTDAYDAEAAARTALAGRAHTAKVNQGPVESLRVLKLAHASAVKQRTAAINQMHQLVATAPVEVRSQLDGLTKHTLPARCVRLRPGTDLHDATAATKHTLRMLARRVQRLTEEIDELDTEITALVNQIAPTTLAAPGVGPHTVARLLITIGENPHRFNSEAAFAALCGTNPIPASSGRTDRHRLNRGGDRQANSAIHMIALSRLAHHQPTRAYIAQRTTNAKSDPHLRRKLKRYITRELFALLRTDLQALTPAAHAA